MRVQQYRKKHELVEAVWFDGHNGKDIEEWSRGSVCLVNVPRDYSNQSDPYMTIIDVRNKERVNIGDWVVKEDSFFFVYSQVQFDEKYELKDEQPKRDG